MPVKYGAGAIVANPVLNFVDMRDSALALRQRAREVESTKLDQFLEREIRIVFTNSYLRGLTK